MRILGIDPGTGILGFGVVDVTDKPGGGFVMVDAGVVRTPPHTPHDERLEAVSYTHLTLPTIYSV